jgi:hypothetical protein
MLKKSRGILKEDSLIHGRELNTGLSEYKAWALTPLHFKTFDWQEISSLNISVPFPGPQKGIGIKIVSRHTCGCN